MSRKLFLLVILLAFTLILMVPSGSAAAGGANRVEFTAVSYNFCPNGNEDPFCYNGDPVFLNSGKMFVVGFKAIMKFDASDPRWDADCYFSADPFSPTEHNPMMGSFTCYPTDPAYAGGYWMGSVRQVFMTDKFVGNWNGKGYGKLDGLLVIASNEFVNGSYFINTGTIIELPGYQP